MDRFKCHTCYTIFGEDDRIEGNCPICGEKFIQKMCPLDHLCNCGSENSVGMIICPQCGEPTCPCGSHDVVVISRVTGYLSDVNGWNAGKRQELKDRTRYNIGVS